MSASFTLSGKQQLSIVAFLQSVQYGQITFFVSCIIFVGMLPLFDLLVAKAFILILTFDGYSSHLKTEKRLQEQIVCESHSAI